jgi:hypothetical protein
LEGRWAPAVLTVSTAADAGPGSLRQAILDANDTATHPGLDTIDFAIGSGPQTIALASPLPAVTDPVVLDGTSQPGYAGTPLIELRGDLVGAGNGLVVNGGGSTIRGLTINRFPYFGIALESSNNTVQGCYVGTTAAGTAAAGNGFSGIFVSGNDNLVGGTTAGQRNVLSANGAHGVQLQNGAAGNVVEGNYIGLSSGGTAALGNAYVGVAVYLGAHDNTVGATAAGVGSGNVIGGNGRAGVSVLSPGTTGNQVGGNFVGTNAAGTAALANGLGVWVLGGATANTVGGSAAAAGNVLSGNGTYGVEIDGPGTTGNLALGNTVGLTAGGTAKLANGSSGVLLATGANGNTVGRGGPQPDRRQRGPRRRDPGRRHERQPGRGQHPGQQRLGRPRPGQRLRRRRRLPGGDEQHRRRHGGRGRQRDRGQRPGRGDAADAGHDRQPDPGQQHRADGGGHGAGQPAGGLAAGRGQQQHGGRRRGRGAQRHLRKRRGRRLAERHQHVGQLRPGQLHRHRRRGRGRPPQPRGRGGERRRRGELHRRGRGRGRQRHLRQRHRRVHRRGGRQ